ncbi:toxin-antitoxin system HicB family antitoxin [Pseudofrankia sp. DC12]|uniref:toxin-antitoxin system HicB family antitoxin n=1 Tax=Pseudofrankia sp. DC12 TaxID=683315 RepID=UPI0005F8451F|nr:toxin-antitoxin system HicB family antitoxin [Pseudofrankia sp. DC12]
MELSKQVDRLGQELVTLLEAGGDDVRELVERLTGGLESAIRLTLLETLSAAANEITQELAPGSVEVRLRGREPEFVVAMPQADQPAETQPAAMTLDPVSEDGATARINVRLPEQLKVAVEAAAAQEGRSVNAWLVRAATAALRSPQDGAARPTGGKRGSQHVTGWVH